MKKILLFLLYSTLAFSQGTADLPQVIPPSPNAANLGKYVETPVGMFTGTPQINIPIYDIKEGDLNLPISLSYQAGGIAVSEVASWTGLGWSLNAGGVITRRVEGLMDESSNGYLNSYNSFPLGGVNEYGYADTFQLYSAAAGYIDLEPDMFFMNAGSLSGKFIFDKNGGIHTIPLQKNKIESLGTVYSTFLHTAAYYHTLGWKVTSEDGTVYKFEALEKSVNSVKNLETMVLFPTYTPSVNSWYLTEITSASGDHITFTYQDVELHYDSPAHYVAYIPLPNNPPSAYGIDQMPPNVTTTQSDIITKRLSKIQFSNGSIDFIPASYGRADLIGDKALEKIIIKDKQGSIIKQFKLTYDYLVGSNLIPYANVSIANVNNFYLGRDDYPVSFGRRLMLSSLVEQDTNANNLNTGHSFEYFHDKGLPNRGFYYYDHWGFANQPENPNTSLEYYIPKVQYGIQNPLMDRIIPLNKEPKFEYCQQGSLKTINYPTGGHTTYDYELHNAQTRPNFPEIFSKKQDIYLSLGHNHYDRLEYDYVIRTENSTPQRHYYTEFQINDINGVAKIKISISPDIPYLTNHSGFYIENTATNHRAWSGAIPSQSEYVTLPNGTYRLYHYPSDFLIANPSSNPTAYNALYNAHIDKWYEQKLPLSHYEIGGLRVKKITIYDPVNNQDLTKTYDYKYGYDEESSGQMLSSPVYSYIKGDEKGQAYIFSQVPAYPILRTQGSYVGYNFVTEKSVDLNNVPLGKTEYTFRSIYDNPDLFPNGQSTMVANNFPNAPADSFDWARGQLIQQKTYKFNDGNYITVEVVTNAYDKQQEIVTEGKKYELPEVNSPEMSHTLGYQYSYHTFYTLHSGKVSLTSSTTEKLTNSGTFEVSSSTTYNQDNYLPSKTSMTTSNGKMINTYYSYPLDYTPGNLFIDNLVSKNIVNTPIEVVSATEDASGSINIKSGVLKEYDVNNPGKVKEIFLLEPDGILSQSTFKFSSKSLGNLPPFGDKSSYSKDSRYKSKYTLDYSAGKLSQTTERGAKNIAYLWGYNEKHPVAMVENATVSDIESTLSASELTAIKNGSYNQATMITTLNKIRLGLPNAFVTTYTYKPLIGVSSITDPKGETVYYEYDEFSRLKFVKDAQGNILSENQYHYKN